MPAYQPGCCCGGDCCHCGASPSIYIIDLGAGINQSNDRCNNCTALTGEFFLPLKSSCVWEYVEEDFCTDGDGNCSDNYKLRITLAITIFSGTQCRVRVNVVLLCNTGCTDADPPCTSGKGERDIFYEEIVLKTDFECRTADFPYTLPFVSTSFGPACSGSAFGTTVDIKEP